MNQNKLKVEELTDKELLEKYFYLACHFNDGLDDFQLDTFYKAEKEILKRMGSNENLETMAENIEERKKVTKGVRNMPDYFVCEDSDLPENTCDTCEELKLKCALEDIDEEKDCICNHCKNQDSDYCYDCCNSRNCNE